MPFHVAGWSRTVSAATLTAVTPVPDTIVRAAGNYVAVPAQVPMIAGYYAGGSDIARSRLVAPSLNNLAYPEIAPLDVSAEPISRPPFHSRFDKPWGLVPSELLSFEMQNAGAGAARQQGAIWFADGPIEPVSGDYFTVYGTGAVALVANSWGVPQAITFASVLPAGRFRCVGGRFVSAGAYLFRFVPVYSGGSYRPGGLAFDAPADIEPKLFRNGRSGIWFEFDNNTPPLVEALSISADATCEVWLDLEWLGA